MDGPFRASPRLAEVSRLLVAAHGALTFAANLLRGVTPLAAVPSEDNVRTFELASEELFDAADCLMHVGRLLEEAVVPTPVLRAAHSRDDNRGHMRGGWSDWLTSVVVRRRIEKTLRTIERQLDRTIPGGPRSSVR